MVAAIILIIVAVACVALLVYNNRIKVATTSKPSAVREPKQKPNEGEEKESTLKKS